MNIPDKLAVFPKVDSIHFCLCYVVKYRVYMHTALYTRLTREGVARVGGSEGSLLYIDKSTNKLVRLEEVRDEAYDSEETWWLDPALDVYSKRANLRQLRRERVIRSPKDFRAYTELKAANEWCPWIPGLSFQTDGVQIKLPICTAAKRSTRGLDMLVKKGFSGFRKEKDSANVLNLNTLTNGIYRIGRDNLVLDYKQAKEYLFVGIDPGVRRPYSLCVLDGANMPRDWKDHRRIQEIDKAMGNNRFMTCGQMEELRGTMKQRARECARRRGTYAEGLQLFTGTHSKTSVMKRRFGFTRARLHSWYRIRKEMMHAIRSFYRFESFRNGQKASAHVTKDILGDVLQRAKREGKKVVAVMGGAVFSQGGKWHSTMPKKAVIKGLGIRVPTLIEDEYRTSYVNPFDFMKWGGINRTDSQSGDRLRQCSTASRASSVSILIEQILAKERERDAAGGVSIGQKSFYKLIGNHIPYYERGTFVI